MRYKIPKDTIEIISFKNRLYSEHKTLVKQNNEWVVIIEFKELEEITGNHNE
jgi:hypothetical protein